MRMNPSKYHGSEVKEDLVDCIDEAYRIMVVTGGVVEKEG